MKYEQAIFDYLRAHPDGATIKAIEIDLGIRNNMVHFTIKRMPTVWVDRWSRGIGNMAAIYKVVPPDAPKPAPKFKNYRKKVQP